MLKACLILFMMLPALFWAQGLEPTIPGYPVQDDNYEDSEGFNYGMSGVVGAINIGDETYSQFRLRPEISLGKFGFGLDIDLLITSDGEIRKEDWQDWEDYVNKIFFVRWANRSDPFYFKAGGISSYTLGHGLIFDHFSNVLRYPEVKNVGGYVGLNLPYAGAGFEFFTHNIYKNEVIAGRIHADPFYYTKVPILEKLKLGINIGTDRNQYGKYPDKDGDGYPDVYDKFPSNPDQYRDTDDDGIADNVDTDINGTGLIDHPSVNDYVAQTYPGITAGADSTDFNWLVYRDEAQKYSGNKDINIFSVDYILPLIETPLFNLDHYGEYAIIDKYGHGVIFPGFSSRFSIFDVKFEFRSFSDEFLPGYFDRLYEENRAQVSVEQTDRFRTYSLTTKEEVLAAAQNALGWFSYLRANVMDLGYIKVAFQDMYGEDMNTGKSLWANVTANPHNVMRLKEASLSYSQAYVPYLDFGKLRTSNANISGRLVYNISETADLVGRYNEMYVDTNRDGKIKGNSEVISSFALSVEFTF